MKKYIVLILIFPAYLFLQSCHRKSIPTKNEDIYAKKIDSTTKAVPVYKAPIKTPTPKSIVVNDKAATKTIEGRYYYDLEGKRYWRNKKDGKYYLYYKDIFENKDFQ